MGQAKRELEEQECKRQTALQIALEAGVLATCELHEDCFLEGNEDIEGAYKLGNLKITNGELQGAFSSRREMTDTIKEVVEEHSAGECPSCAKWRDE